MFPYEKYDIDTRMLPILKGDTVHSETIMFVGKSDRARLLFDPTEILSVTSYDRHRSFVEGRDFVLGEDGCLCLTPRSKIPCMSEEAYWHNDPAKSKIQTMRDGEPVWTHCGEGKMMTRWQVVVSYRHKGDEGVFVPPSMADRFPRLLHKLRIGEDVSLHFFGDSITAGCSASYYSNIDPHMPSWPALVSEYLAKRFSDTVHFVKTGLPGTCAVPDRDIEHGSRGLITSVNTAVGGWKSDHAVERFDERIGKWIGRFDCDLLVLAFGMNGKKKPEELIADLRTACDRALERKPDLSILLVSTMLPNPEAAPGHWYHMQDLYEEPMKKLADEYAAKGVPAAVVPMTSVSKYVLSRTRFRDVSGNNINHPNDFMIRLYAQTLLHTLGL